MFEYITEVTGYLCLKIFLNTEILELKRNLVILRIEKLLTLSFTTKKKVYECHKRGFNGHVEHIAATQEKFLKMCRKHFQMLKC